MSDTSVTATAVKEIAALAREGASVQKFLYAGRDYTDRAIYRVDVEPRQPTPLAFFTLAAFAAYLAAETSETPRPLVHVESPTEVSAVSLLTGSDRHLRRRLAVAQCSPQLRGFSFDERCDLDELAIALQTCFAPEGQVEQLRKFCAAVRATDSVGVDDDGVSQTVNAKRGIAAVQETAVNNPWMLAPWRTFAEVRQPLSPFVLRFHGREGGLPSAGLYETGDARWQVEAVSSVAATLRNLLGPEWQVLG